MNNKNQGLNERLAHKKRIQRMKTGVTVFVLTWMLVWMLVSVTLIVKVQSLQNQIDILTENTIRSQQIGQQQNQAAGSNKVKEYEAATGTDAQDEKDAGKSAKDKEQRMRMSGKCI